MKGVISFEGCGAKFFLKLLAHAHHNLPAKFLCGERLKHLFEGEVLSGGGEGAIFGAVAFREEVTNGVAVEVVVTVGAQLGEGHDVSTAVFDPVKLEGGEVKLVVAADVVASRFDVASAGVFFFEITAAPDDLGGVFPFEGAAVEVDGDFLLPGLNGGHEGPCVLEFRLSKEVPIGDGSAGFQKFFEGS